MLNVSTHPQLSQLWPLDGFCCSFCGDWFSWPGLTGYGDGFRYCDSCAHVLEMIFPLRSMKVDTNIADNGRVPTATATPNLFADLDRFRLTQDFAQSLGVKKRLVTVPVRKPGRQQFVRVHPDEGFRLQTAVLELKDERETYVVDQPLWPDLIEEITPKILFTAVDRQNNVFLWPVRLPGEDGRIDDWNRSALEAADMAIRAWVRVKANMSLGAYDVYESSADIPDPKWPDQTFGELLTIAFKGKHIDTLEHPVIRKLRGEV